MPLQHENQTYLPESMVTFVIGYNQLLLLSTNVHLCVFVCMQSVYNCYIILWQLPEVEIFLMKLLVACNRQDRIKIMAWPGQILLWDVIKEKWLNSWSDD